ncbi:unnamed protein product [Paramecium sonneborni]|uniref:B30.2/SPRY domain-containing protein n=1 Tax=Paramecium sonneborni TaxID=65129 RepID=A0A8S1RKL6_9CILI|nr:unnamed protein product [Paramecium sonneborni]
MNQILCKNHPDNSAIYLLWNSQTLQFACEECHENYCDKNYEESFKKLTIRKALKEPHYFLKQFNLDEKSKRIIRNLENIPETILKELIEKMEKSLREIQIVFEKAIIELKEKICLLLQSRDQFKNKLGKISYYTLFIQIMENLNVQQFVTHDYINQIEDRLKELFCKINDNSVIFNSEIQEQLILPKLEKKEGISQLQLLQNRLNQFRQEINPFLVNNQDQFSKFLTFSKTHKHLNSQVSQNGKVIETDLNIWQCCLCDQMIPKLGVTKFAFKILEMSYIMIGFGIREIVKNSNYENCSSLGGGTYCIYNPGYCYSHDQKEIDNKYIGWGFSTNDIIIVEVDMKNKYVKWTKQSINKSFAMNIDTTLDLYPCLQLNSKGKVEIINQSFSQENY